MKGKRFSEEKIIGILKEYSGGVSIKDLVRTYGVSEQSIYRLDKRNTANMAVSDAKRLRELEQENSRLKRLLADAELDKAILKDVLGKKW